MLPKAKSVVGLDIGTTAVKAVELTQRGKGIEITAFGQVEVPEDDQDARNQAIRELLEAGGFKTKRIVTAVSGKEVIVRYLNMVRMGDDEMKNAILFEAEKYVPFPLDECVIDCQRLEEEDAAPGGANMNVVLAAAKKSQLEEHMASITSAGFTPEAIEIDAFALGNAFALCRANNPSLQLEDVLAFIDIGAAKTNVNILVRGASLFTREIPLGGRDLTHAISQRLNLSIEESETLKRNPDGREEELKEAVFSAIDDLGNEIQISFDYFQNQYQREISRILLSGGGSRLEVFLSAFERIFEKPTTIFNPFEHIAANESIDADLLAVSAPQLVVATGLASRAQKG